MDDTFEVNCVIWYIGICLFFQQIIKKMSELDPWLGNQDLICQVMEPKKEIKKKKDQIPGF